MKEAFSLKKKKEKKHWKLECQIDGHFYLCCTVHTQQNRKQIFIRGKREKNSCLHIDPKRWRETGRKRFLPSTVYRRIKQNKATKLE